MHLLSVLKRVREQVNLTLEEELERLADLGQGQAVDYLTKYNAMKAYLEVDYYPWIQATCPFFTDHGKLHVESVMMTASMLLENRYGPEKQNSLNELEIFLLLSAILWHDVGNVMGRAGHAEKVKELTSKIQSIAFGEPALRGLVVSIVKAHAGEDGLQKAREEQHYERSIVYPRALAAVLRFADEISETAKRISHSILESGKVPEDNLIFWEFANCIIASVPEPNRQRIILNIEIQLEKISRFYRLKGWGDQNDVSLIEYIVHRIEKINNERAYCDREFRRYLTIREVEIRLNLLNDTDTIEGYDNKIITLGDGGMSSFVGYPLIKISGSFFQDNPEWGINTLKEVHSREAK